MKFITKVGKSIWDFFGRLGEVIFPFNPSPEEIKKYQKTLKRLRDQQGRYFMGDVSVVFLKLNLADDKDEGTKKMLVMSHKYLTTLISAMIGYQPNK